MTGSKRIYHTKEEVEAIAAVLQSDEEDGWTYTPIWDEAHHVGWVEMTDEEDIFVGYLG